MSRELSQQRPPLGTDGSGEPIWNNPLEWSGEQASHRRSLLEATLQTLPIGVAVYDSLGQCILANATALQLMPSCAMDVPVAELENPKREEKEPEISRVSHQVIETRRRVLRSELETYWLTTYIDITQSYNVNQHLMQQAFIDSLTGLPNRLLVEQFVEDLIASMESDAIFALAFIDLDNFKHINDYYSHAAGDALLTKIADRVLGSLRPTDMLARVGGDEFVLLVTPTPDPETARTFVAGVAERLKEPFYIEGHEIFASASIGVSMFPTQGRSYDVLRRKADTAMYQVKGGVKGGVTTFNEAMNQAATERIAVEQRLRLAIRDKRFCCAFQPKVDIHTGKVHGVEVLLRWQDDQGIVHAPGNLIQLAIELGLINEITFQVLDGIAQSFVAIEEAFGPGVSISINIAAKQACDIVFMTSFIKALAATGCAERFILELTEEAFFTKSRFQTDVLPRIRAVGARISIDDFGVGYSSLGALAEITADEIKIDRTFITDIHKRPRSQVVLKAIESLGYALGISVIAEGVESIEEVAYLQTETQIRYAQGYYFARPMLINQMQAGEFTLVQGRSNTTSMRLLQTRQRQINR